MCVWEDDFFGQQCTVLAFHLKYLKLFQSRTFVQYFFYRKYFHFERFIRHISNGNPIFMQRFLFQVYTILQFHLKYLKLFQSQTFVNYYFFFNRKYFQFERFIKYISNGNPIFIHHRVLNVNIYNVNPKFCQS